MLVRLLQLASFLVFPIALARQRRRRCRAGRALTSQAERSARPAIFRQYWHVGTCGISSILITSPNGHILIDGATEKAARRSRRTYAPSAQGRRHQVHLSSHEHSITPAALRNCKRFRCSVVAREPAATTLERGQRPQRPQFGVLGDFPPCPDSPHQDGETVSLGRSDSHAHADTGTHDWVKQ